MATQDYADQLTAIYNQLSQINGILSNLSTVSAVNTIQGNLSQEMATIYGNINSINQAVRAMELAITSILCHLRSS